MNIYFRATVKAVRYWLSLRKFRIGKTYIDNTGLPWRCSHSGSDFITLERPNSFHQPKARFSLKAGGWLAHIDSTESGNVTIYAYADCKQARAAHEEYLSRIASVLEAGDIDGYHGLADKNDADLVDDAARVIGFHKARMSMLRVSETTRVISRQWLIERGHSGSYVKPEIDPELAPTRDDIPHTEPNNDGQSVLQGLVPDIVVSLSPISAPTMT